MKNYDKTRNAVYQINYHIVWCTKYRRQLLSDKITDTLKELLMEICEDKNYFNKVLNSPKSYGGK